jgi:hypothetical protein
VASRNYFQGPYFEIRYGKANFFGGTTKVNAWVLEGEARSFPSQVLTRARSGNRETVDDKDLGDFGHWSTDYLEAKAGTILYITAERTVRRIPRYGAGILLRLRDGAPTYQVTTEVTPDALSRYASLPVFVGRADILEYDQCAEEHGIILGGAQISNWLDDIEEFEEAFTVEQLASARTGPPTIVHRETEDGVEAVTVDPAPRRKVMTRRKR